MSKMLVVVAVVVASAIGQPQHPQGKMAKPVAVSPAPAGPSPEIRAAWDSVYERLLERTNQQLGLWTNPYGIMVGIVAVLVGLLAVGTAYAIFRQGKDYRAQLADSISRSEALFNASIAKYEGVLTAFLEEKNKEIAARLAEAKGELQRASGDDKNRLQAKVDGLEKALVELRAKPNPLFVEVGKALGAQPLSAHSAHSAYSLRQGLLESLRQYKCIHCGHVFETDQRPQPWFFDPLRLTCPNCGQNAIA